MGVIVLIPYQQGSLFRRKKLDKAKARLKVLIPYQQGSLFRPSGTSYNIKELRLNPLSAGKSFQT